MILVSTITVYMTLLILDVVVDGSSCFCHGAYFPPITHWVTLSFSETKVSNFSMRPNSHAKCLKPCFSPINHISLANTEIPHVGLYFCFFSGQCRLLYHPMLQRHLRLVCFVNICESWSDLVWYFGLRPKFCILARCCILIRCQTWVSD